MDENQDNASRRSATERADELLTRAGQTAGIFASVVGMRIARIAAFAREEVEDMWAEAQSIRQGTGEAETNGNVETQTSEGVDVSQESRREMEEQEPEKSAEPDGEARAGTAASEASTSEAEEQKPEQDAQPDEKAENIKATDAARRRAEELDVDLGEVEGTGASGQITVEDVKKKAESEA
jgi:pyruvate/2-oxoglutarate dehydrogenase complex dihydrolipoamide acyltransferase (E2) component